MNKGSSFVPLTTYRYVSNNFTGHKSVEVLPRNRFMYPFSKGVGFGLLNSDSDDLRSGGVIHCDITVTEMDPWIKGTVTSHC